MLKGGARGSEDTTAALDAPMRVTAVETAAEAGGPPAFLLAAALVRTQFRAAQRHLIGVCLLAEWPMRLRTFWVTDWP